MARDTLPDLVLHVWPGNWGLPTIFPECLAAILYAQLTIPEKFVIEECTNPDLSPDGQLPYLTDGLACIASLPSIVKYISGLRRRRTEDDDGEDEDNLDLTDLSASLTPTEKAKENAWAAFVSAHLGDLVACSFFTLRHNYREHTRPALAQVLQVPQRYYLPDRLRDSYKPRLDAAGLWTVHMEEAEEEQRKRSGVVAQTAGSDAFGKEKVLETANTSLRLLADLLGDKQFFFGDRPTTLDVLVAAHILLLTVPPFPNDLLRTLLTSSYPTLHAHARRIHARTIPTEASSLANSLSLSTSFDLVEAQSRATLNAPPLRIRSTSPSSLYHALRSLVPSPRSQPAQKSTGKEQEKDKTFDRMRWLWYATALGALAWGASAFLTITVVSDEEDEAPIGEGAFKKPEADDKGDEDEEGVASADVGDQWVEDEDEDDAE